MSLAAQDRGLFVLPAGGLGIRGLRTLGSPGSQGGVFHSFPLLSSFVINTGPPSELLPVLHQGVGSLCSGCRFTVQSGNRTSVFGAWPLQPLICSTEGHGWLAASHRSFSPQPLHLTISLSYGDGTVGPPISLSGRLNGFTRPSGCLPPCPCPSGLSEVPLVLYWPSHLPVSGSLLWIVFCSTGLYSCHGPDLLHNAPPRLPDSPLYGRLACPWFLSRGDCLGEGLFVTTMRPSRCINQPFQEFTPSDSNYRLPRDVPSLFTFEGFPHSDQDSEGAHSHV